jgi:hypothetical protein
MKIRVPYFDDCDVQLDDEDSLNNPALVEFLKRDLQDRLKDSRHVFNYYQDFRTMIGGEDWLDDEMGIVTIPEQIWSHVTPRFVLMDGGRGSDESQYVIVEAECAWEVEHGLMMVWKDGKFLCKVGGYDGHVTNSNSYADDKLINVVYSGSDDKFTTHRDR